MALGRDDQCQTLSPLPSMLCIAQALDTQLREAMQRAFPEVDALLDPQLAPASKPEFGDFQANGALPLAKPLKQAPRQTAAAVAAARGSVTAR